VAVSGLTISSSVESAKSWKSRCLNVSRKVRYIFCWNCFVARCLIDYWKQLHQSLHFTARFAYLLRSPPILYRLLNQSTSLIDVSFHVILSYAWQSNKHKATAINFIRQRRVVETERSPRVTPLNGYAYILSQYCIYFYSFGGKQEGVTHEFFGALWAQHMSLAVATFVKNFQHSYWTV
jgi:hypothetical protein